MADTQDSTAVAEPKAEEKAAKPKYQQRVQVASIHSHFNIFRPEKDGDGPVTVAEQIAALERHVRWHERQVAVGKELVARLKKLDGAQ